MGKRKAKHLLGKKNNNSPWVWGEAPNPRRIIVFFAQKMLRLSGLVANTFSVFCCIKFSTLFASNFPAVHCRECRIYRVLHVAVVCHRVNLGEQLEEASTEHHPWTLP